MVSRAAFDRCGPTRRASVVFFLGSTPSRICQAQYSTVLWLHCTAATRQRRRDPLWLRSAWRQMANGKWQMQLGRVMQCQTGPEQGTRRISRSTLSPSWPISILYHQCISASVHQCISASVHQCFSGARPIPSHGHCCCHGSRSL